MSKNVFSPAVESVLPVEVVPQFDVDPVVSLPLSQLNFLVESLRSVEERVTSLERNVSPAVAAELKRMDVSLERYLSGDMRRYEQIEALRRSLDDAKADLRMNIHELAEKVAKIP